MASPLTVLGWSTRDLPASQVLEYSVHAIGEGLEPMSVEIPDPGGFNAELQCVLLPEVVIARGTGHTLRCIRTRRELGRDSQRCYHLVLNRRSHWDLRHRGEQQLRVDDAAVMDSAFEYDFTFPCFDNAHLQFGESWMRRWVRDPAALAGRVILKDATWGAALCSYVRMLTPDFMANAPLPPQVLTDHLGALLGLVAHDVGVETSPLPRYGGQSRDRILDMIQQRCTEPGLTATDVADSLNISPRTLHRHLGAFRQTFGAALIDARVSIALRMLESRAFRRLTIWEIARRTGFLDASHFARAVRARTGRTPQQFRPG